MINNNILIYLNYLSNKNILLIKLYNYKIIFFFWVCENVKYLILLIIIILFIK